jgi:hypothetical protein
MNKNFIIKTLDNKALNSYNCSTAAAIVNKVVGGVSFQTKMKGEIK